MDLLSALASVILDRAVDLSATDIQGSASGGSSSALLYPAIGVDLSVPRADNQWYLLSWPERGILLRVLQDGLNWSEFHVSSNQGGDEPHADVLAKTWSALHLDEPTVETALSAPLMEELQIELRELAAERDRALTSWKNRVSLKVSGSRDLI
jgi:hypothetical protein